MPNSRSDQAMVDLAVAGFSVGSLSDRELTFLQGKTAVGKTYGDKAKDLGYVGYPPLGTYGNVPYADAVLADSPLGYWRKGEAAGTTMVDSSGNGHNGTYVNAPGLAAAGLLIGDTDKSVDYDGTNDYASVAYDVLWMIPAAMSIEFLVNPDVVNVLQDLVTRKFNTVTSSTAWYVGLDATGHIVFMTNQGGLAKQCVSTTVLVPGNTYHIVGTHDTVNGMRLYINKVLEASDASLGAIFVRTDPLRFGCYGSGSGRFFNGRIDEVSFYGSALPLARVQAHYDSAVA